MAGVELEGGDGGGRWEHRTGATAREWGLILRLQGNSWGVLSREVNVAPVWPVLLIFLSKVINLDFSIFSMLANLKSTARAKELTFVSQL